MKQKKLIIGILTLLILLTAVLAIVHFSTRDKVPEGALMVTYQGKTTYIAWDKLALTEVSGTIVNGKGEEKEIRAQGIPLAELASGEFRSAAVSAEDEYSATVTADEADHAYLIVSEDGSLRLIVFGDSNSKRDVKHVGKVEFR